MQPFVNPVVIERDDQFLTGPSGQFLKAFA
jgi:hypothetical protein